MIPANIIPVFVNDEHCKLFEFIFNCAENGCSVWVIAPQIINQIPLNLKTPGNEVLKLITFMYLKDYKDLIKQFNTIHLWHKVPNVIIVTGFEHYSNINSFDYAPLRTALIITTLLDSGVVCAKKRNSKILILVKFDDFQIIQTNQDRLNNLLELYFPHIAKNSQELYEFLSIILGG